MRAAALPLAWVCVAVSTFAGLSVRFAHPDVPGLQLLMEYWPVWAAIGAGSGVAMWLAGRAR